MPINFTVSAEQAIAPAYPSVRGGGEVRLVHVTAPTHQNVTAAHKSGNGHGESQEVFARLRALVPKTAASRGITTYGEVVEHHEPAAAICQAAERFDPDLICMGSRDRSHLKKAIFRSVSQDLMARSDRAVLVIRGKQAHQGAGGRADWRA